MAKKKKHAPPPPPPGHGPKKKKKRPAPKSPIDSAALAAAVERIRATRLGLDPHERKQLGRDLGRRYILEHSEGYHLKNILEGDAEGRMDASVAEIAKTIDPAGVSKTKLAEWLGKLLPDTSDPLDEHFAAGLSEGLSETAAIVTEKLRSPATRQHDKAADESEKAPPKQSDEEE